MSKYYALRAFKAMDPRTEKYVTYLPGQPVPGAEDWPHLKRWIEREYITGDASSVGKDRRNHRSNVAVDGEGKSIPAADLAAFKADRDLKKLADKPIRAISKEARRLQLIDGSGDVEMNKKDLLAAIRKSYLGFYEEHDAHMARKNRGSVPAVSAEIVDTGHDAEPEPEHDPDDTDGDDRYDESELKKLRVDALHEVAMADFDLDPADFGNKAEVVDAIIAAGWTPQALAKLSRQKLVEIAEGLDLELDETASVGKLVPAILEAQEPE